MVTGAFSYTGSAVARELQRRGFSLFTLTNRRPPENATIPVAPLRFDADHLTRELSDTSVLVNTYWVRLPYANESFSTSVENSRILIEAAKRAGVRRLVHISVSNAARGTNLGYHFLPRLNPHFLSEAPLVGGKREVDQQKVAFALL